MRPRRLLKDDKLDIAGGVFHNFHHNRVRLLYICNSLHSNADGSFRLQNKKLINKKG